MAQKRGGTNPKARKVTPENYPLMKELLAGGLKQADLGRAFKLSSATTSAVNRFDTYEEYRDFQLKNSYKSRSAKNNSAEDAAKEHAENANAEQAADTIKTVEAVEKPTEEKHPAFVPSFTEANQERIIELLEQILKKLDCAEMVVSSDEEPKRRGLFSFGSKSPF